MAVARRGVAVLATAVLFVLAGCAGPAGSRPERSGDDAGGPLTVYAAASLAVVFDRIAGAFRGEHPGVDVTVVTDGSATLATQIAEGAPADVFAAADEASMARLGDDAGDPVLFATNTLVLVVPAANPAGIESLADLADATVVLCAPEVPCGAASATLLERAGVEVTPASLEQNVTAVLTKVAAGEADAGLVYATDAREADDVRAIEPVGAAEVVNRYPITVLPGAPHPTAAAAFVEFVLSPAGGRMLAAAGFGAP